MTEGGAGEGSEACPVTATPSSQWPDFSMWACLTGDDPLTGTTDSRAARLAFQYNDIQNITNATGGSFTLTFRQKTREPIYVR
jgi:hypothetical protein